METKYGSEHLQVEKSEGLQSYLNFSAFGFAVVVSNLLGILDSEGVFGIHIQREFSGECSRQKTSSKCLLHESQCYLVIREIVLAVVFLLSLKGSQAPVEE